MKLPNPHLAIVDIKRLREYCLNTTHPYARGKAKVLRSALGISEGDEEALRIALLRAVQDEEAEVREKDHYGIRYRIDFETTRMGHTVAIRSGWIVRTDTTWAELLTCWVLRRKS